MAQSKQHWFRQALLNNKCDFCTALLLKGFPGIQSFRTHGRFVPRLRRFVPTFGRFVPHPLVDSYPTLWSIRTPPSGRFVPHPLVDSYPTLWSTRTPPSGRFVLHPLVDSFPTLWSIRTQEIMTQSVL